MGVGAWKIRTSLHRSPLPHEPFSGPAADGSVGHAEQQVVPAVAVDGPDVGGGQTVRLRVVRELRTVVLPRSGVSVAEPKVAVGVLPNGKNMLQCAGG